MTKPQGAGCPMHMDEFIQPVHVGTETAEWQYACSHRDHPGGRQYTWPYVPEPVAIAGDSLGLGLDLELPKAVKTATSEFGATWVEHGLVERAYALANPEDWATLLQKYSHTYYSMERPTDPTRTRYSASMYLARTVSALARTGSLAHEMAPGTGRWSYNNPISFLGLPPGDGWDQRATWAASSVNMDDYMPDVRPT